MRQALPALLKLLAFAAVSLVVTAVVTTAVGGLTVRDTASYRAVFTDASRLLPGDDVRIAGVAVGEVQRIEVIPRGDSALAAVTFAVERSAVLTRATRAEIRYLNVVGNRYLALTEGTGNPAPLAPDATIGLNRTAPALDLTVLFNGFKPLFAALSPEDVNQLSMQIIRTLQGEGGTVASLLASTASLTSTLADRDQLIGQVVDNLNALLGTLDGRRDKLGQVIGELQRFVSGLAEDRTAIGESLVQIDGLAAATGDLVGQARPALQADIEQLNRVAATLTDPTNKRLLEQFVQRLPAKVNTFTRAGSYGSWFNFYLCDMQASITLPELTGVPDPVARQLDELQGRLNDITVRNNAARCAPR